MNILDLMRAHVRTLLALAAIGFCMGTAYGTFAPKWYESTISLVPTQQGPGAGAAGIAASLPGLSSLLLPGAGADVERIDAVLKTNAVSDAVITRFDLKRLYGEKHIEHARRVLWKHCSTKQNRKAAMVQLTCEDPSPARARDIAAYFGEIGNEVFSRVSTSSAGEERRFLEKRVREAEDEVSAASRALREFQERYKIIDISEQSRAVVSAMASMQADLLSTEMQRDYAKSFASQSEASVQQLERKAAVLRQKMNALESPKDGQASAEGGSFFPSAMSLPERRAQVEPLIRELKIREAVLLALTQRYEMAKVDAARDTSTFQVLDPPTLPSIKSRPSRLVAALSGTLAGLAFGAFLVIALAELARRKREVSALREGATGVSAAAS